MGGGVLHHSHGWLPHWAVTSRNVQGYIIHTTKLQGIRLLSLQVDKQKVEGGVLCHVHGHVGVAVVGGDVAERGLRGLVRRGGLLVSLGGDT